MSQEIPDADPFDSAMGRVADVESNSVRTSILPLWMAQGLSRNDTIRSDIAEIAYSDAVLPNWEARRRVKRTTPRH